jgi:hypothetical protein|tara:strand:- start:448 stop:669 length:222 start_codon:yes stop_codon:yes gene_type:complete
VEAVEAMVEVEQGDIEILLQVKLQVDQVQLQNHKFFYQVVIIQLRLVLVVLELLDVDHKETLEAMVMIQYFQL